MFFLFHKVQILSIALATVQIFTEVKRKKIINLSVVLVLIWYYNYVL